MEHSDFQHLCLPHGASLSACTGRQAAHAGTFLCSSCKCSLANSPGCLKGQMARGSDPDKFRNVKNIQCSEGVVRKVFSHRSPPIQAVVHRKLAGGVPHLPKMP